MLHTNQQWYAREEFGSFYRLEGGMLCQSPMKADGTQSESDCVVDWTQGVAASDEPRLRQIVAELERLP
jgi:hypothetical protein